MKKWSDLNPSLRRVIVVLAALDGAFRTAALVDLVRRRQEEVHGNKVLWGLALTLVNSLGIVPLVYFRKGRVASQD